eukprot:1194821-Prorocentrum_minimum.AAC.5
MPFWGGAWGAPAGSEAHGGVCGGGGGGGGGNARAEHAHQAAANAPRDGARRRWQRRRRQDSSRAVDGLHTGPQRLRWRVGHLGARAERRGARARSLGLRREFCLGRSLYSA